MLALNKCFSQNANNLCYFVDASMNIFISTNQEFVTYKEYFLYYYIKSDFKISIQYLSTLNIEYISTLDFMIIWRNIRHSIESLYDLYNLIIDPNYYSILEYNSKQSKQYNQKYKRFIYRNKYFTIRSKKNIAEELYNFRDYYNGNSDKLFELSKKSNNYIHPNVFVNTPPIQDIQSKANLLIDILDSYIDIFNCAYNLILYKYNGKFQPILSCINCRYLYNKNCANCYRENYMRYKMSLKNIFYETNSQNNNYTYQIYR